MRAKFTGLGDVGVISDQEGYELAPNALTTLRNMRMAAGSVERVKGHIQVGSDTANVPYYLLPFRTNTASFLIWAGVNDVRAFDGSTVTDITGPAIASTERYTHGVLGGVLLLNNGLDNPMYWGGDTAQNLAVMPGWTATHKAKSLRALKNHAIALNITKDGVNYPRMMKTSKAAVPGAVPAGWSTTVPANGAVERDLAEVDDPLVDGLALGDIFIAYGTQSMYGVQHIGGTVGWRTWLLPDKVGMLAPGCAAKTPLGHVVLAAGDVVVHNGNGVRSILNDRRRNWLMDNMDLNYYGNSFVVANPTRREVLICFPERGYQYPTKALIWNWESNALGERDLPNATYGCAAALAYAQESFDNDSVTFDSESVLTFDTASLESFAQNDERILLCTSAKEIFLVDSGGQFDGSNFTATAERTGIDEVPGLPQLTGRVKYVQRIWPQIDGDAGAQVSVQIGGSMVSGEAVAWETAVTYTIGTDEWLDLTTSYRYLAWRITATGSSHFRMRTMLWDIEDDGEFA